MGVFTVGRQVALEIDMPGWWLANASVDMDFRRGLYYDSSTANPRAATDFLSCVRASAGYARTADGTLTSFASNALRITSAGLLVEDARTNQVTFSQDISNAVWTKDHVSIGATTSAPDGTTTGQKIVEDGTNNEHRFFVTSLALNITHHSIYAKAAERSWIALRNSSGSQVANFDLATGNIGTTNATSAAIEAMGGGWYRCMMGVASGNVVYTVNIGNADTGTGASGSSYTGDGTSGLYVWGAQGETTGTFASSYIPTTGAAATRAADAVTCIGSMATIFSTSPSSGVADCITPTSSPGAYAIFGDSGSGQAFLGINNNTSVATITGVQLNATIGNSLTFGGGVKVGYGSTSGGTRSVVGGGGTVASDSNAPGTPIFGVPKLGSFAGLVGFLTFGRATVWNSRLADATLQALTAP